MSNSSALEFHNSLRPIDGDPPVTSMMRRLGGMYRRFVDRGCVAEGSVTAGNVHKLTKRVKKPKRTLGEIRGKRDAALQMWRTTNLPQAEIAARLNVSSKSVSGWVCNAGLSGLRGGRY